MRVSRGALGFLRQRLRLGANGHSFGIRKLELCTLLASQAHPEPSARTEFSQAAESRQWGYAIPSGYGHVVHSIASAADARARRMPSSHTENNAHTLREIEGGWRWPAFQTSKKQKKWFRCAKQIEHCQQGSCRESCECVRFDSFE